MVPMSCTELGKEDRAILKEVAHQSIGHGLIAAEPLFPSLEEMSGVLIEPGASFVTLTIQGVLRGCIGTLEAEKPLVLDVAENAFSAAFRDPRFERLDAADWPRCDLEISILSQPEPLFVASEAELLSKLRPGVDGLILRWQHHRATFLPSVWESLSKPADFVAALKQKAGLTPQFWHPDIRVFIYQALKF